MLVVHRKVFIFNVKTVYFSDQPFDVEGCDVVNFIGCRNEVDAKGLTYERKFTAIIDLTQDLEVLWRIMDKKSTRYEIKRAEKEAIKTHLNQHYKEFWQIHKDLQRSKGFGSVLDTGAPKAEMMRKYGTLFTAECEGEILGGHLYLEDEDHIMLWLSASRRLEMGKERAALIGRANRLLHWEAIKYAKEKGIKEFDWGGMWSEEEAAQDKLKQNINSFKLSFGGEMVTRYSYQKIYSKTFKFARYIYHLLNRGK
jgi:hypothetical protein